MKTKTTPENEVAKQCIVASIERDLGDDNGFASHLLQDAAEEIERLFGFHNAIIRECTKPLDQYEGGYVQKNALIQAIAETAIAPSPTTRGKL